MKSRILALALIGILLSSPAISVADAYVMSFAVTNVNGVPINEISRINFFKISLLDGIVASLDNRSYESQQPIRINMFDGILSSINDKKQNDKQFVQEEKTKQRIISLKLGDGVGTHTKKFGGNDDDIRIVSIKQDHDRKALWERIFPLDRIRGSEKESLYKVIQDDHGLSTLQVIESE